MHARKSSKEGEADERSQGLSLGHMDEYHAIEEHYEQLDSFITQLPIEQELTMEEISAFQTSVAMEMAVANEIEDPAPWVDVSILGSTALIPPPDDLHSTYIALPTGMTSFVDLPVSYNLSSADYIYQHDVDALLDGTHTIGEMAAQVNENEAEDLIKELLNESSNIQPAGLGMDDMQVAINPQLTLKVISSISLVSVYNYTFYSLAGHYG